MATLIRRILKYLNEEGETWVVRVISLSDIVLRNTFDCSFMLVLCSSLFYDDKLRAVKNF